MAEIFVSYTSSDRDWANWVGLELERLGHVARVHEWEIRPAATFLPGWRSVTKRPIMSSSSSASSI